jgi:hypothetical protein
MTNSQSLAYITLTNGNIAGLEENLEETLNILADVESSDEELDALRNIATEAIKFLTAQRKIDEWLKNNISMPDAEAVDYALEVADSIGLTETFGVRVVALPKEIAYKEALDILFSGE